MWFLIFYKNNTVFDFENISLEPLTKEIYQNEHSDITAKLDRYEILVNTTDILPFPRSELNGDIIELSAYAMYVYERMSMYMNTYSNLLRISFVE